MRHLNAKLILTTVAITGVIGAGVAVAADQPTCPYGNTPQAGQSLVAPIAVSACRGPARGPPRRRRALRRTGGRRCLGRVGSH